MKNLQFTTQEYTSFVVTVEEELQKIPQLIYSDT